MVSLQITCCSGDMSRLTLYVPLTGQIMRVTTKIRAGTVWVNQYAGLDVSFPRPARTHLTTSARY